MDKDEIIELGRAIERLRSNNDFNKLYEAFTTEQQINIAKAFDGSKDDIEALIAIRYFEEWITNILNNAKVLLKQNQE